MADFTLMYNQCKTLQNQMAAKGVDAEILAKFAELTNDLDTLQQAERPAKAREKIPEVLTAKLNKALRIGKIDSGVIAEIGGAQNSFLDRFPQFEHRYLSIFPKKDDPRYIVADITNCPHVPSDSFDVVFSTSVLEHVTRIQHAGQEIVRILKPGGVTVHAVPFSYFFHGAPVDYWRVTTSALESIFEGLDTIECFFYNKNRRRNNLGSPSNPIDKEGGPMFATDAFGGWRENWFTIYVGRKPRDAEQKIHEQRVKQAVVDIIRGLIEEGFSEEEALQKTSGLSGQFGFDDHGRLRFGKMVDNGVSLSLEKAKAIWSTRGNKTVKPSPARFNAIAMLKNERLI